ncbi:MAG: 50S ribosomal protein L3 [Candidatus Pacebacteria bacterium]|nr:50S ribosomal protein L3 [Candidatus Paceibacterota bacterium]
MINTVFGTKLGSQRYFTRDGAFIPATKIKFFPLVITQIKSQDKDGYQAVQVGIGEGRLRRLNQPQQKCLKGAGIKQAPLYFREVRVDDGDVFKKGQEIKATEILKAGDLVKVTGYSKGKGFTGVMKRWGFAGGPRTHGQSDRPRSPGSIGQTTTPGRVFKGKKMAGHSGQARVTIKNLEVLAINDEDGFLLVSGLVPGFRGCFLQVKKIGRVKRVTDLLELGQALEIGENSQAEVEGKEISGKDEVLEK